MFAIQQAQKIFGIWNKKSQGWVRTTGGVVEILGEDQAKSWYGNIEQFEIKELTICCDQELFDTKIEKTKQRLDDAIFYAKLVNE